MSINLTLGDYKKLSNLRLIVTKTNRKLVNEKGILRDFNVSSCNIKRYLTGKRSLPIKYLFNNSSSLIQIMETRPIFTTNGGIKVTLPNKINNDIAYLTGLICGDGNLLLTKKRDYRIRIDNKEKSLLKNSLRILKENFGYSTKIRKGNKCWCIKIGSAVIYSFFNKIMEIENGRKNNIVIPEEIKGDRKLVRSFIAGFFDAEGSVGLQKNNVTCQIIFYQKQKRILERIRDELIKDGIKMKLYKIGINYWALYGNKDSLKPFLKNIKFLYPKKRLKLETAVKNTIN